MTLRFSRVEFQQPDEVVLLPSRSRPSPSFGESPAREPTRSSAITGVSSRSPKYEPFVLV